MRPLPCFLAILLLAGPVTHAGDIYKITDKNGHVTFTDRPPAPGTTPSLRIESLDLHDDGSNRTPVTINAGGDALCGNLQMPSLQQPKPQLIQQLQERRAEWDEYLRQLEQQFEIVHNRDAMNPQEQSGDNSQLENTARNYRCAVHWVEQQQDRLAHERQTLTDTLTRLQAERDALRKRNPCSTEPSPDNAEAYKTYVSCMQDYGDRLRIADRAVSSAEDDLQLLQDTGE